MADILVADDTRAIRSALSILLEEEGHAVRVAAAGLVGLVQVVDPDHTSASSSSISRSARMPVTG